MLEVLVCQWCASPKIQVQAWIWANSRKETGGDPPHDDVWCSRCQSGSDIKVIERMTDQWAVHTRLVSYYFSSLRQAMRKVRSLAGYYRPPRSPWKPQP